VNVDSALVIAVGSFVSSVLVNSAASALADQALVAVGKRLASLVRPLVVGDQSAKGGVKVAGDFQVDAEVAEDVEQVVALSPALRRARMVASVLRGAQILWVDDKPDNNLYERMMLKSMGASIELVTSTEAAMLVLASEAYDVVISDMTRGNVHDAGLELLEKLRQRGVHTRLIFYVWDYDEGRGVPAGAFGMTNLPDELLHLILDALERVRV
jgi:CheY-like chemotaxis protein